MLSYTVRHSIVLECYAEHCALNEVFNKAHNGSGFPYVNEQGEGIMKCVYKKKDEKSTTGYLVVISFRVRQFKTHGFPRSSCCSSLYHSSCR